MIHGTIAATTQRKTVGKCIYCGALENLHDEHCLPDSLNGYHVLAKGSCNECGKITSEFEGRYTRDALLPVRTAWNMKSKRSKKKRPTEFPMRFIKNGKEKIINVPIEDHYSIIPLFEIGAAGALSHTVHAKGLLPEEYEIHPFKIRSDEHIEYLKEKYDAEDVSVDFEIHVLDFLRMIAKIAYCFTVWRYGLQNIAEVYVLPAILGTSNDIWHWVGSDGEQFIHQESKNMNTDHVTMTRFLENGELLARVKLFKKSLTPEYEVLVGKLTPLAHDFYKSMGFR